MATVWSPSFEIARLDRRCLKLFGIRFRAFIRMIFVKKILRSLFLLRKGGHRGVIWQSLLLRLFSDTTCLGLRRDLSVSFKAAEAKIPLKVRPLDRQDDLSFIDINESGISSAAAFERLHQINMLKARIRTCYLALGPDGRPCYMQWLIPSSENDKIQALYGDIFPRLEECEALLEGAYTAEDYRGQGVMASAMARIAERGNDLGARWVITFVAERHIASLKGCKKAGFVPYVRRRDKYRLFRRNVTFTPLPEGTPYPFEGPDHG
jgi:GNAT superfamily N-acetyltransferase